MSKKTVKKSAPKSAQPETKKPAPAAATKKAGAKVPHTLQAQLAATASSKAVATSTGGDTWNGKPMEKGAIRENLSQEKLLKLKPGALLVLAYPPFSNGRPAKVYGAVLQYAKKDHVIVSRIQGDEAPRDFPLEFSAKGVAVDRALKTTVWVLTASDQEKAKIQEKLDAFSPKKIPAEFRNAKYLAVTYPKEVEKKDFWSGTFGVKVLKIAETQLKISLHNHIEGDISESTFTLTPKGWIDSKGGIPCEPRVISIDGFKDLTAPPPAKKIPAPAAAKKKESGESAKKPVAAASKKNGKPAASPVRVYKAAGKPVNKVIPAAAAPATAA